MSPPAIDTSGMVIGTATLGLRNHDSVTASWTIIFPCDMPFTISNVPSQSRYGF